MPASASWAWTFWASLTEVAYSPCETMLPMVRPSAKPAVARYALALATSRVGQGRAFGSLLYAGDVMGPDDLTLTESGGVEDLLAVDGALDGQAHVDVVERCAARR